MRAMRAGEEVGIPLCEGDVIMISTERVRWREGEAMNMCVRECVRATDSRTFGAQLSLDSSLSQSYWQELLTSLCTLSPPCPPTKDDGLIQHNEAFQWARWCWCWLHSTIFGINFSSSSRPFSCEIWWTWSLWVNLWRTVNHDMNIVSLGQGEPGSQLDRHFHQPKRKRWYSKFGDGVFTCSSIGQLFTVCHFIQHNEKIHCKTQIGATLQRNHCTGQLW